MTSNEPLLTVSEVSTRFRTKRGRLRAVENVSLSLEPGETLGLVGESGSGKSVLGQTIMGLVSHGGKTTVTGKVLFEGRDMQKLNRKEQQQVWGRDIAMVFQDPMSALNPFKKIGTHITESLRAHLGLNKAQARERAIEMLRTVRIPEPARRIDQYPHELSGGMRQRVVIAMALACDPKFVIADEPTTALDVTVQKQILELLDALRRETGMAGILISHDLGVVAGQTDRVAVMYAGRVVETAPTRQLFTSPRHPYTEALLAAVPRIEQDPHTRLESIEGGLPDMTKPPQGCSFASRCKYSRQQCRETVPDLVPSSDTVGAPHPHEVACHFPLDGRPATDLGMPHPETLDDRVLEMEAI
ncbi:ABC transporter ATP-binding protein [Rhodococcus gordoniae]|uniref:ABC transporter ATP-binding protein n=1 Tax=Rhodococcus gordoniae TaxID=223392 RepID=UPI0020CDAA7F|nr:ABC transporter ATP-binding protein [Rhodococcus gordoniae]UTT51030.1 ABC transporter ATP-binding protein [Rhodococcus gordoniae]